jgi:hypothetical protein
MFETADVLESRSGTVPAKTNFQLKRRALALHVRDPLFDHLRRRTGPLQTLGGKLRRSILIILISSSGVKNSGFQSSIN